MRIWIDFTGFGTEYTRASTPPPINRGEMTQQRVGWNGRGDAIIRKAFCGYAWKTLNSGYFPVFISLSRPSSLPREAVSCSSLRAIGGTAKANPQVSCTPHCAGCWQLGSFSLMMVFVGNGVVGEDEGVRKYKFSYTVFFIWE